jgi:lipooligosaccharide transport system permease protein
VSALSTYPDGADGAPPPTAVTTASAGAVAAAEVRISAPRQIWRQFRYWGTFSRRTWKGTVVSALVGPLLYLLALGVGLGKLVTNSSELPGGVNYVSFVAPGVLAATAMQNAFTEGTYPVFGSFKWFGNYITAAYTPQRPQDILLGHAALVFVRVAGIEAVFFGFMGVFGTLHSPLAILALPAAVLTAAAFLLPLMALTMTLENESGLSTMMRFIATPLFVFSGTFFPWQQLPGWAHPVVFATPLWHGVELCRSLTLGTATWSGSLAHIGYLIGLTGLGYVAGRISYRRRLYA